MRSIALVGVILAAVVGVSLAYGDYPVSMAQLFAIVGQGEANPIVRQIVLEVRLPRVVLALLVGAALGVAGVITQSILRNPLGEPGLLGVNNGAALVITILVVLVPHADQSVHSIGAFAGAMVVVAMVYGFSILVRASMARLVLVGVGIGALTGGLATGVSLLGDIETAQRLMAWLAGSVYDSSWPKVAGVAPWLIVPTALAWSMARDLDVLVMGDDIARGLGLRLQMTIGVALTCCALLSALSVTLAGPIAFVGLIAPHLARRMGARNHVAQMPLAGLMGALIVASADLLGRSLMPPVQLPVGLITPLFGVPLICLVILWRRLYGRRFA